MKCDYCLKDRDAEHGCIETYTVRKRRLRSQDRVAYIDTIVREIKHSQVHPGWMPQTSEQIRERAARLRDMENQVQWQN